MVLSKEVIEDMYKAIINISVKHKMTSPEVLVVLDSVKKTTLETFEAEMDNDFVFFDKKKED